VSKLTKNIKADLKELFTIEKSEIFPRLLPLTLFAALIIIDQITKALVVHFIPLTSWGGSSKTIHIVGDWIKIIHVRNQGVAWSGFGDLIGAKRIIILIIVPILFLSAFGIWVFFTKEMNKFQRWASAAIMAGGLGNIIDRVFRYASGPTDRLHGVVDFVDMSFPKIPFIAPSGRWPTFNVADSCIVIGVSLLVLSMLIFELKSYKKKKKS